MVATTTPKPSKKPSKPSKTDLLAKLTLDYPDFRFRPGPKFAWRPPKTIIVGPAEPFSDLLLLHELGHALSGHTNFATHIERLKMESEAWGKAKNLAKTYAVPYNQNFVEAQLDTYRDWLHQKSLCKTCGLTRYQTPDGHYHCPHCDL